MAKGLVILGLLALLALDVGRARAQDATPDGATASDDDAEARLHFQLGSTHYRRGRFLDAAHEFEISYELSHRAALHHNIYLAYRDANLRDRAAAALRRYLAEETAEIEGREMLTARLEALEADLERERREQQEHDRDRDRDREEASRPPPVAAITLLSLAGVTLVGGGVSLAVVLADQSTLANECPSKMDCDPALEGTADRVQTLAVVTDVLFIASLVSAGVGIAVLLAGGGGDDDLEHASAQLTCGPFGCSVSGRF